MNQCIRIIANEDCLITYRCTSEHEIASVKSLYAVRPTLATTPMPKPDAGNRIKQPSSCVPVIQQGSRVCYWSL